MSFEALAPKAIFSGGSRCVQKGMGGVGWGVISVAYSR